MRSRFTGSSALYLLLLALLAACSQAFFLAPAARPALKAAPLGE